MRGGKSQRLSMPEVQSCRQETVRSELGVRQGPASTEPCILAEEGGFSRMAIRKPGKGPKQGSHMIKGCYLGEQGPGGRRAEFGGAVIQMLAARGLIRDAQGPCLSD